MMDNWQLRRFRNDLSEFISLIENHKIPGDFSVLMTILDDLNNKKLIEYKIENLCFYVISKIAGAKPDNLNYFQIYLDIMLMTADELSHETDPLHAYYLDINIQGYASEKNRSKNYHSSWHLDKHKPKDPTKYSHPTYHFQFGGKKMELIDEELCVLSSPRIPHPPMDLFLGFHFVLANFYNNKQYDFVNNLLTDPVYQQIIGRAKSRLWKPYFGAFGTSNTHKDFTIKNIFPLYADN
jgi:hypothetical protein